MTSNNILNNNNWAALPGGRTHDPIHILNNVMEDARENKKELWAFFQDISKAYDSISVTVLEICMERLKIPYQFISIIKNLLKDRSNRVITFYGLTDEYKVNDGIDQGDAISPLLWRIFYDPLLEAVRKSKLGYLMSTEIFNNNCEIQTNLEQRIYTTAYMDDTVWIASNKKELQHILNLTSEFCQIVDIKVNPSKSQVIHINPSSMEKHTPVFVDAQPVYPMEKSVPVRYLGIWVSQSGSKKFQRETILNKIINACKILNWKRVTDKQIRYIVNQVIFPQIEYLLTDMLVSNDFCNKVNSKLMSMAKQKMSFAKTTLNSIFYMKDGYNFFNLQDRQLQIHGSNWLKRLNDNTEVGTTTRIRLQNYQNEAWQPSSILENDIVTTIKKGHNLTGDILELLKAHKFTFKLTKNNTNILKFPLARG